VKQRLLDGFREHRRWIAICILVGLGMSGAVACTFSRPLPFETQPFSYEVEDVEIVTCRELDGHSPISVTDVFTEDDQQICVSVSARLKDDVEEMRRMLPPDTELPFLTVIKYYEGQKMKEFAISTDYSPDGWVTGGYCLEVVQGSLPKGRYEVKIKLVSVEVGTVEYQIQ